MEPDYWFYPQILGDSSGQYAFQSIWLTASKLDNCNVCGQQSENRETPYSYIASTPNPVNIRKQISS